MINNEKGISLIEVIASLVILSFILISFVSFFPQMGKTNNSNEDKQQAISIAKTELIYWKDYFEFNGPEFKSFISTPSNSFSFIQTTDEIDSTEKETKIIISTKPRSTYSKPVSNYSYDLVINTINDLENGTTNAYQIIIKMYKNETIPLTETYGYVFINY
ncbi:type IV pilus modification PilV family protein [Lysinibacillus endophyticus]|uniref:type IV pilus modification PilV family protein n=1 Tax=Ureibacillus endophyticus TaxID=1978490 RepID=UPI0031351490